MAGLMRNKEFFSPKARNFLQKFLVHPPKRGRMNEKNKEVIDGWIEEE